MYLLCVYVCVYLYLYLSESITRCCVSRCSGRKWRVVWCVFTNNVGKTIIGLRTEESIGYCLLCVMSETNWRIADKNTSFKVSVCLIFWRLTPGSLQTVDHCMYSTLYIIIVIFFCDITTIDTNTVDIFSKENTLFLASITRQRWEIVARHRIIAIRECGIEFPSIIIIITYRTRSSRVCSKKKAQS